MRPSWRRKAETASALHSGFAGWLQSKGEVGHQILEQLSELLSEDDPAEKVRSLFS